MLDLSLSLEAMACLGAAAEPWTPEALFGAGEVGGWYDPSDGATLFQERTGASATTPAVVDGVVGTMLDKSGNGFHLTAPSDGARPILRSSGGLYWLEFDGTDDYLIAGATMNLGDGWSGSWAKRDRSAINYNGPWKMQAAGFPTSTSRKLGTYWGGTGFLVDATAAPNWVEITPAAARTNVLVARINKPAGSNPVIEVAMAAGTVASPPFASSNAPTSVYGTDGDMILYIGVGYNNYDPVNFYGLVLLDRVQTADEIAALRTFHGSKVGLTL